MQRAVERELSHLEGRFACTVVRLGRAGPVELITVNPELPFPAASLAKVPILIEVSRQVSQGLLSWDHRYSVPKEMCVEGSGVLHTLSPNLQPTLQDLAMLMITVSDNTASNILLDLVGIDAVNSSMRELGLTGTRIERRFMDFASREAGRDNWTTAGDMSLLFSYLCTDFLPGKELMLEILLRQNENTILSAYWDEDTLFAHKTGGLTGILHDAGILYPPLQPNVPLIIVALTSHQPDVPLTRYVLSRLGRAIYDIS